MSERHLGFNDRQREAAGTLPSGGVTLLSGTSLRWQFLDFLNLTNRSTSSGVTLSLYKGGRFVWSISCGALFTISITPPGPFGFMGPSSSTGEDWQLTLGTGSAKISYIFVGHESRDSA